MEFLKVKDETEKGFREIAQILFDEYAIQTHKTLYRLVEIEFYWHSSSHPDKSTYDRKHTDPDTGEWFFHYSGVDIALRNRETGGYGGILIRGIYDCNIKKITSGPMVCAMKLFSGYSAFSKSIETRLIPSHFEKSEIEDDYRVNLGENAKSSGTDKLRYAFKITPKS